jgi:hypothetical protein
VAPSSTRLISEPRWTSERISVSNVLPDVVPDVVPNVVPNVVRLMPHFCSSPMLSRDEARMKRR